MSNLILLRHGNSVWNQQNLFTGWVDVRLSQTGEQEAANAGRLLREADAQPDVLFTSLLTRAIQTAQIALLEMDRAWLPTYRSWRLNERHYGQLQGKDKAQTLQEFGAEQFQIWRRSYDVPPPPIAPDSEYSQVGDPRYADMVPPETECLKDVQARMLPYWQEAILPQLQAGKTVLVTAHGNSLRALVKHLEGICDEAISELNIPTGIPLCYQIDQAGQAAGAGEYLDPAAAAAGAAAVAAQGK